MKIVKYIVIAVVILFVAGFVMTLASNKGQQAFQNGMDKGKSAVEDTK